MKSKIPKTPSHEKVSVGRKKRGVGLEILFVCFVVVFEFEEFYDFVFFVDLID